MKSATRVLGLTASAFLISAATGGTAVMMSACGDPDSGGSPSPDGGNATDSASDVGDGSTAVDSSTIDTRGADASHGDSGSRIAWAPCPQHPTFDCATVPVPLDYDDASLGTTNLAVLRAPAQSPAERVGVLFTNPGGPGAPQYDRFATTPANAAQVLLAGDNDLLYQRFDIIALDWRGVGASKPAITCFSPTILSSLLAAPIIPTTDAQWTTLFDAANAVPPSCTSQTDPKLLARVDTASAAKDMDRVRDLLGEDKINYLGYSYGTYLGAMYATLFPTRVRGFVLDSPFTQDTDRRDRWLATAAALEDSLVQFFAWCAGAASCTFGPATGRTTDSVASAYDALTAKLDATPLTTPTVPLDGSAIKLAVGQLLYAPTIQYAQLGAALAAAEGGNGTSLRQIADHVIAPNDAPSLSLASGFLGISEIDYPLPSGFTDADLRTFLETQVAPIAPRVGYANAIQELSVFVGWPIALAHAFPKISAKTAPPLLITATQHDPATPYAQAAKLQTDLGNGSHLLTYAGVGHAQSTFSPCLAVRAALFLLDPSTPPDLTACPQVPF